MQVPVELIGLPMGTLGANKIRVVGPKAWGDEALTQYLVARVGPYLKSIETIPNSTPLGGCKCLGKR